MIYFFLKRVLDIFGAIVGIVVFSPIFLVTAIAIKIDSPGSVFVEVSDRVGQNGKKFRMYKFRSMIADAHVKIKKDPKFKKLYEEYEKNDFKLDNDPRVTKVGMFIRRTSVDEIPQFINVIIGNMSLVGPRAFYPEELETKKIDHPKYKSKINVALKIKPGITGLWQISGRSEIDFPERISMDADYEKSRSILYDIAVLIMTIPAVVKGKGAQ